MVGLAMSGYFSVFVLAVFCMRTLAKIVASVIQRVTVPMVPFFAGCAIQNQAMHINSEGSPFVPLFTGMFRPSGIKTSHPLIPLGAPIPLRQPFKVGSIDDSV